MLLHKSHRMQLGQKPKKIIKYAQWGTIEGSRVEEDKIWPIFS